MPTWNNIYIDIPNNKVIVQIGSEVSSLLFKNQQTLIISSTQRLNFVIFLQLEMSSDKLMESVLNLTLFGTEYLFSKLREPVNKTDWITHGRPAIVNAFYSSIENSIRKLYNQYLRTCSTELGKIADECFNIFILLHISLFEITNFIYLYQI